MTSTFEELRKIDVSQNIEKKGKFHYLSWVWALEKMYTYDPDAEFSYDEKEVMADGSIMIYCNVTIKGKTKKAFLPVMNHSNNAIQNPNARQVSDSMQRCLVKAIALHGLGLGLYAGEDLPQDETLNKNTTPPVKTHIPAQEKTPEEKSKDLYMKMQKAVGDAKTIEDLAGIEKRASEVDQHLTEQHKKYFANIVDAKKVELKG